MFTLFNYRAILGSSATVAAFTAVFFAGAESGQGIRTARAVSPTVTAVQQAAPPASPLQNLFVNISEKIMPSVVNISTTKNMRARPRGLPGFPGDPFGGLFQENPFEGSANPPRPLGKADMIARPMSLGTGFVISAQDGKDGGGLILTNNHVIAGADDITVKFTENDDEHEVPATIVGRDPDLDIAVLKVKTDRKLVPAPLGDSDKLKVGEWIAAIGNPFGHGHSMSHGIVSAKERALPGGFGKYLQVDAPINPGNSGGPLVDMNGAVIGINNAIDARGPGIGFAIPINAVKELLPELESHGRVERGFIGINIMPLRPDLAQALHADAPDGTPVVAAVVPGQPADRAGFKPYDVVAKIDGRVIKSPEDLMATILKVPVGHKVKAQVLRGGKTLELDMAVGSRPEQSRT